MLAKGAFAALKERINPERFGGAPLLGLNGHILKSHGSANRRMIKSVLHNAHELIRADLNARSETDILRANELIQLNVG
jgi:glycerol-3-phosphate acyltransferase PlsX